MCVSRLPELSAAAVFEQKRGAATAESAYPVESGRLSPLGAVVQVLYMARKRTSHAR